MSVLYAAQIPRASTSLSATRHALVLNRLSRRSLPNTSIARGTSGVLATTDTDGVHKERHVDVVEEPVKLHGHVGQRNRNVLAGRQAPPAILRRKMGDLEISPNAKVTWTWGLTRG